MTEELDLGGEKGKLLLRKAVAADAERLCRFGATEFTRTFGYLYVPHNLETYLSESYTPEVFLGYITDEKSSTWLAETSEGEVAGYSLAGPCTLPHDEITEENGEIKKLYIAPTFFGTGTAQSLFDKVNNFLLTDERYKGKPRYLSVWSENFRAQKFYKRNDFDFLCEYEYVVGEQRDREWIYKSK